MMDFRGWVPPEIAIGITVILVLAGSWVAFLLWVLVNHVTVGWH